MSVYVKPGILVRIKQFEGPRSPQPLPLESGFSAGRLYEILGMHCASESSEAYCIMANDLGQMWFISNRHLQVCSETSRLDGPPMIDSIAVSGAGGPSLA